MRRKRNLDSRLAAFEGLLLPLEPEELDHSVAGGEEDLLDCAEIFGREAPLELEIGCGKGRFICETAAMHPETNFLAVEKAKNVMVTACEHTAEAGLENVRFIALPAEYLLRYIRPQSVRKIYLNFSCPYPKGRFANRRLTHPKMLAIYRRILAPDGVIAQKTDNMHFFEYSLETLSQAGFGLRNVTLDLHSAPVEGDVMTEYEQKFSELGQPIYRLEAFVRKETDAQ